MSVQFGRWNFEGQPPAPDYIEKVSATLAPHGPDSNESYSKGGINILYRAFYTTKESRREKQPHISSSGAVITWDGRLDNRAELISELSDSLTNNSTDVAIVAAAYEKWGANCLGKLIGDWALSIWNPRERSILLAKDPIGTKHLYYSFDDKQLTWCTILDPLVLFGGRTFEICEEYIAGWFSYFPATHLTPYVGIYSVPPSSSVLLRHGSHEVRKYWDFDAGKKVRYRTDAEYEEHFRAVFAKAVQRRLRSDRPVLAELSGGMDSSAIVCMADIAIAQGAAETPRLDTISWYNDSIFDLNERPYFTKVEEKRGRTGCHIDLASIDIDSQISSRPGFESDRLAVTPIFNRRHSDFVMQCAEYRKSQGHRVTLSGLAGENATGGGMPTPRPELQDLMATLRFSALAHQLKAWSAKMKKPWLPLLWEAVRGFFPPALEGMSKNIFETSWFHRDFVRRHRVALCGYPSRVRLFGPLPSFQDHLIALDADRRLMAYYGPSPELLNEARYPYLDRGLLEFVYAIPREQLVRVGQRRSLMRRALAGIVPGEILNRKRYAPPQNESLKVASPKWPSLAEISQPMVSGARGIIDPDRFLQTSKKARHNQEVPLKMLKKTLMIESWLQHLTIQKVLMSSMSSRIRNDFLSLEGDELHVPARPTSSAS